MVLTGSSPLIGSTQPTTTPTFLHPSTVTRGEDTAVDATFPSKQDCGTFRCRGNSPTIYSLPLIVSRRCGLGRVTLAKGVVNISPPLFGSVERRPVILDKRHAGLDAPDEVGVRDEISPKHDANIITPV